MSFPPKFVTPLQSVSPEVPGGEPSVHLAEMGNSTPPKNAVVSEDSATTISPCPIRGQDFQALIKQEERGGGEDRGDGQLEERHEPVKVEMKEEPEAVKIKKEPELPPVVYCFKRQNSERTIHGEIGGNPQQNVVRSVKCKSVCWESGKCCCDCKDFNIPKDINPHPRSSPKDPRNTYVFASTAFHPYAPCAEFGRTAKSGNIYGGTLFFPDTALPESDNRFDNITQHPPTFPLFVQQYHEVPQEGGTYKKKRLVVSEGGKG